MFNNNDYGKPISEDVAKLFKGATVEDYIQAGIKAKMSSETVRSIVGRKRNLLKKNSKCLIELAKILKKKTTQLDNFLKSA